MSCSLKSFKGGYIERTIRGPVKGDTRNLDDSSYEVEPAASSLRSLAFRNCGLNTDCFLPGAFACLGFRSSGLGGLGV